MAFSRRALASPGYPDCPQGNNTQRPAEQRVRELQNAAAMAIDTMRFRRTKAAALPQHSTGRLTQLPAGQHHAASCLTTCTHATNEFGNGHHRSGWWRVNELVE